MLRIEIPDFTGKEAECGPDFKWDSDDKKNAKREFKKEVSDDEKKVRKETKDYMLQQKPLLQTHTWRSAWP